MFKIFLRCSFMIVGAVINRPAATSYISASVIGEIARQYCTGDQ